MESFRDYLVIDRTRQDVQAQNEKGTYNAADLNRVTRACCYVATRLRAYGYGASLELCPAYLIATSVTPYGGGTASGGVFFQGEEAAVTARPNGEYTFLRWAEDGETVSEDPAYRFTAERSRRLTAVFKAPEQEDSGVVGRGVIGRAKIGKRVM